MPNKFFRILFSKIRRLKFIDYVLLGCVFLAILIFAIFFFRKSAYINATIKVGEDSVYYQSWDTSRSDTSASKEWFANSFYPGQSEKDGTGQNVAEVLSIFSYNKTATRKTVFLNMKLKVVYNRATNTYTYKGVPVLIGSKLKLSFNNVYVEGMVTSVDGFPQYGNRKKIVVESEIREESTLFSGSIGTKPYVADAIRVGDGAKDNRGNVIIKIIDKRVTPAMKTVTTSDGRVFQTPDPVIKDVFLTLEIEATETNGQYFILDDIPVIIDQVIPINTSQYSIFPTITKFVSED